MSTQQAPVLIVEDDPDIREALVDALTDVGYTAAVASNGREALAVLRSLPVLPKVILLDLMMPEMDGFQFRAAQTRDPELAHIPVVLVTAVSDTAGAAERIGAAAALRKPVQLSALIGAIERFV